MPVSCIARQLKNRNTYHIHIALINHLNHLTMQEIKIVGMIHIPGVNDEVYTTYINSLPIIEDNNLWYQLP